MTDCRSILRLPWRMGLAVLLLGAVCVTGVGVTEYALALRTERRAVQSFVEGAGEAVASNAPAPKPEAMPSEGSAVAQRLRALRGQDAVLAWRVLDGEQGERLYRSPFGVPGDLDILAARADAVVWSPGPGAWECLDEAALRQLLVIRLPFTSADGSPRLFEAAIDGPARHRAVMRRLAERLVPTAGAFALIALTVVVLMYRWVGRPLVDLAATLRVAGDAPWHAAATVETPVAGLGEELRSVFGALLDQWHDAERRARVAEQMAGAARRGLLSLDRAGVIRAANPRAVAWLGGEASGQAVVGERLSHYLEPADRARFERAWPGDEAGGAHGTSCRLRLANPELGGAAVTFLISPIDPLTQQATAVFHPRERQDALQQRFAAQQRLLQSAIDANPQPWLLTDASGVVQSLNRAWAAATRCRPDAVVQANLRQPQAWSGWGAETGEALAEAVNAVLNDPARVADFDDQSAAGPLLCTAQGPRRLHAEPYFAPGASGGLQASPQGFAWTLVPVVSTRQAPGATAVATSPVAENDDWALRFGDLREARTTAELLDAVVQALHQDTGVTAVGIAVRSADPRRSRRSDQRMALAGGAMAWADYARVRDTVEGELMPEVLRSAEARVSALQAGGGAEWADALETCGLLRWTAVALRGVGDDLGVLWIAQRLGASIPPSAQASLSRLAEWTSARLDTLRLTDTFRTLGLLDGATGLPTTPALLRHLQALPKPADPAAPHHVLMFTADFAAAALSRAQRDELAQASADRLRARCRRSVFLSATGAGELVVAVQGMAEVHVRSLGDRLFTALCELGEASRVPMRWGMATLRSAGDEGSAGQAVAAARVAALATPDRRAIRKAS